MSSVLTPHSCPPQSPLLLEPSGCIRMVHYQVVLVPASPDATPSSLMRNRFAVFADEEIVSQDSGPIVTQPAAQPLPTWQDSSEEGSRVAEVSLRRMEHTQVDSAEDDSPASVVSGVESEEFDLTRGDDEIENHAPTGEGSSRDGMSEIDASDVPPVHVEVEPDSMPTRIPAERRAFERERERDLNDSRWVTFNFKLKDRNYLLQKAAITCTAS